VIAPRGNGRAPEPTGPLAQDLAGTALETAQDPGVTDHDSSASLGASRPGVAGGASLSGRVVRGASWTAFNRLAGQAVQFAAGLVLARLLTPSDYGTMASIYVITGFAVLFFELGLGSVVVALRDPSDRDLSTVFWLNALAGVAFTLLLAASGPLVAAFFGDPRMASLTPLTGLAFLFGIGGVHNGLLQRALRFRAASLIGLVATSSGIIGTVVLALLGLGVYALVLGPVVASILYSALSWAAVPWRPKHFISRESLPRIWRFSGGQLGFNVVNYWGRNGDNFFIARFVGTSPLGLYNKAYSLMLLPVQQVSQVLGEVMFPALAAMGDDHVRVARGYRRAVSLINVATVPVLVGMAAVAPGLVPLLWGNQWLGTVHLLMILCFAGVPQCLTTSVGWLFMSQHRTGLMFRVGLVSSVIGLVMIVVGVFTAGAIGVAVAVLVRAWISLPPTLHFACRLVGLRARTVLLGNVRIFACSAVMFAVVWSFPALIGIDRSTVWVTGVQIALGAVVYLGLGRVLLRNELGELVNVLLRRGTAT